MSPAPYTEAVDVSRLTDDQIARLAAEGRVEPVARGAIVQLDMPAAAIVAGAWFRGLRRAACAGDVTLFLAKPGDVLAPGAIFGERSAESGAQAVADAEMLFVPREFFERHAAADPALYIEIAANVGRRIAESKPASPAPCSNWPTTSAFGFGPARRSISRSRGETLRTWPERRASRARKRSPPSLGGGLVFGGRLKRLLIADRPGLEASARTWSLRCGTNVPF
jgi:CRP-like cAMP-binding protein